MANNSHQVAEVIGDLAQVGSTPARRRPNGQRAGEYGHKNAGPRVMAGSLVA